jgi:glycosyltransferase involved in cell wall biosynthesis
VGRLSAEKGIKTLIRAMTKIPHIKLRIAGSGPEETELKQFANDVKVDAEFLGYLPYEKIKNVMNESSAMIVPSECFENSPNVVLESYALGRPVIGADIGGIPELVFDGETGYAFAPGDHHDLAEKIMKLTGNVERANEFGRNGYRLIKEKFNEDMHYKGLMSIYESLIKRTH